MSMQQCPNGHLYDNSVSNSCPFCGGNVDATVPVGSEAVVGTAPGATIPVGGEAFPSTRPVGASVPPTQPVKAQIGVTVPLDAAAGAASAVSQPAVVGWLVSISENSLGRDFRVHSQQNTIGRGEKNDICLDFDMAVSKESNATLIYDSKNNSFYLKPDASKNNIYVNNEILLMPVEIMDYDVIEIGETQLMFRSFVSERFTWESIEAK